MMIGFQYFERSLKRAILVQLDHGDHGLGIAVRIIFKVNKVFALEFDRKWIGPKVTLGRDQVLELIERIIGVLCVRSKTISERPSLRITNFFNRAAGSAFSQPPEQTKHLAVL